MNTVYRLVWNASLGLWVAVSELAKARGKGKSGLRKARRALPVMLLSVTLVGIPGTANAWMVNTATNAGTAANDGGSSTNVAIGSGAVARATDSTSSAAQIAIGYGATSFSQNAIAIGWKASAESSGSIAFGPVAQVYGAGESSTNSLAIGNHAYVMENSPRALALGAGAQTTGDRSHAIGANAMAKGFAAMVIGSYGSASADNAIAIGSYASASAADSFALGSSAVAGGINSVAQGNSAKATGANSMALGGGAQATATQGTAIGYNAKVTQAGGLALGSGSVASTAAGAAGFAPAKALAANKTAITATASTQAAVSVGDASNNVRRQITGVAAGTANTDAVNVAQLRAVADAPLTFTGNSGSVTRVLGDTVTIKGGKTTAGAYSAANLNTVVDTSGNVTLQMADNPVFTSAIIGGTTTLNSSGMTITGGPSVTTTGVNAGSKKVTNVAAGTLSSTSTDGVNGSQLYATNQNVATNTTNINTLKNTPLTFAGNTGTVTKKLGETLTVKGGKTTAGTYSDKNLNTVVDANGNLVVQMAENPVFTSAIIGGTTTLNSSGMTITGG
ncbi:hypothetical protein FMK90_08230, partial [Klebsiella grimontii]|nr:hypothetical protein [Klebsiella grimontii]